MISLFFFSEEGELSDTSSLCSEMSEIFRSVSSETMSNLYTSLCQSVDREGNVDRLTPLVDNVLDALNEIKDNVQKK